MTNALVTGSLIGSAICLQWCAYRVFRWVMWTYVIETCLECGQIVEPDGAICDDCFALELDDLFLT